ncbi:hypothetical protein D9619_005480 [Psilocybe cf. subviscida]|uniref:SAP domain-containing protein n=1 Tax=Psilocybe cf. subviscida TaxID=2480587 RepID=A0A8H5FB38_9AGAR|nr:hypothetical protein D9619_005480 [Psilocybe cf. subviscida]
MLIRRLPFWARNTNTPNSNFARLRQFCLIAVCCRCLVAPATIPSSFMHATAGSYAMETQENDDDIMDVDHPEASAAERKREQHEPAPPEPAPTAAAPPRPGHLPFPKLGENNKIETQYIDITSKKVGVKELKSYCAAFGLPTTGKKEVLKNRLVAFSETPERWETLKPRATRTQLGPRREPKRGKGAVKQSTLRAAASFPSREKHALAHMPLPLPSAIPVQTESQRAAILNWAKTTVDRYPYLNKAERHAAAAARLESRSQSRLQANTLNDHELHSRIANVEASLSSLQMTVPSIYVPSVGTLVGGPPALASTPLAPPALVSAPLASVPSVSPLSALLASAPSVSALPPLPMSLPDQVAEPSIMRTLHLADGVTVTFSASDVGPPPATTFASDIDLLNRMWDDTSKHWGHYSHLVIKNQYIPIVYWKQVYSRWPRSAIVSRYRQGTEEEFWAAFTDVNGNRMTYSDICKNLQDTRAQDDERLAAQARNEYGEDFNKVFTYKKHGQMFVKRKAADIAKQYRTLQGHVDDDDD